MPTGGTIAALATPPGRSARALVRVSGPDCDLLARRALADAPEPPGAGPARLRLGPGLLLPVLAWRARAPRTFTGEDTLELSFPGNPELCRRVLAALCEVEGVRPANPGEFSARAYLNGRLSLEQAEGVAALVSACTNEHLAAARGLLDGSSGARYRDWADRLLTLLSLVEAGIDFTEEEDVRPITPERLRGELAALEGEFASFLGSSGGREAWRETPLVVLAGAPNAGKSTLFNALLGRVRAVSSPVAGTTRDALEEPLTLEDPAHRVTLCDLPGLDDAARSGAAGGAQVAAREALARAAVVLWCDPSGVFEPAEAPPAGPGASVLRVRTKADRHGLEPGRGDVGVCALDGRNLNALRRLLSESAWGGAALAWAAPRHALALASAAEQVRRAAELAHAGPELAAQALRSALSSMDELAGRLGTEDVLGRIFSTFCVGK